MPGDDRWTRSDAWFAAAVASCRGHASLNELIDVGDAINHAIFMRSEIELAVRRLAAAGLLETRPGPTFELTREGAALLARRSGGMIGQTDSVMKLLMDVPVPTVVDRWSLDEDQVDEAYRAYIQSPHRSE
jgi:hypothetical protein